MAGSAWRGVVVGTAMLTACGGPSPGEDDTGTALRAPGPPARAQTRSTGGVALELAGGAETSARRDLPYTITITGELAPATQCIGLSLQGCRRWTAHRTKGTWRAPVAAGTLAPRLWLRDAQGTAIGTAATTITIDSLAPERGQATATPTTGGLTVAWADFSDADTGLVAHRISVGTGTSAPACSSEAAQRVLLPTATLRVEGLAAVQHTVKVCGEDALGNLSSPVTLRAVPLAETVPPTVSGFTVSGGAAVVSSRDVTLGATVADPGAVEICTTERPAATAADCAAWRPWTDGMAHTLEPGAGAHTLRAWFRDAQHNLSSLQEHSVVLDPTPPTGGTLALTAGAGTAQLAWSGFTDDWSDIAGYVVVGDSPWAPPRCTEGTELYRGPETTLEVDGLAGESWAGFRVCAVDAMGHVSAGVADRVRVREESDPPVVTAFTLDGGAAETLDRRVDAAIAATDASGLARMCLSTHPTVCTAWQAHQPTAEVQLPASPGLATVYLWLEDAQGIRSPAPATAQIRYREPVDLDGDGHDERTDCDDDDETVFPDAEGRCALGESCAEILATGRGDTDGTYMIDPDGAEGALPPFHVHCDMHTEGGGWTEVAYAADLPYQQHHSGGDGWRTTDDFAFALDEAQIAAIQAISEEGRQVYEGRCNGVLHHFFNQRGNHEYAFGFVFFDGTETARGQEQYPDHDIAVVADGCATNGGEGGALERATVFSIDSPLVPLRAVQCRDCGDANERYGALLTDHPAWLR